MILDIGCGWRKRGDVGIDYVKFPYGKKGCLDVQADAETLPFRDAAFDRVIAWNVIEHSLNAYNYLKECTRVLKDTGELEIVTDNPYHYMWSVLKPGLGGTEHSELASDHYCIFYPKNLERLLAKLNFEVAHFSWEVQRPWIITYPFAKFLVKIGIWRKECLFWTYKIVAKKKTASETV